MMMVLGMFVLHLRKQSKMEFFRSWFIVNYLRRYTPTSPSSHQSSEKSYYKSELKRVPFMTYQKLLLILYCKALKRVISQVKP